MRVLVRAMIPTTAGNRMVKDPNFLKTIEDYTNQLCGSFLVYYIIIVNYIK